jgi:hypothetical protein
MRRLLRILASALGALLVIGETLRSYGQGRPLAFVADDYLIGGGLILASAYFNVDTLRRRAAFAAAWAATSGGLYGSFFGKLLDTTGAGFHSNIPDNLLTGLIGAAYATSLFGLVATIALREPRTS